MAVFPDQGSVRLESAETQEPADRAIHLVVKPSRTPGNLEHFRGAIVAGIGDTLHAEVAGLRITLRIGAKRESAVEGGAQLAADLGQYAAVAQVVLAIRLRLVLRVESQTTQIGVEGTYVDVVNVRAMDGALLGEDISERVVEFLKLSG